MPRIITIGFVLLFITSCADNKSTSKSSSPDELADKQLQNLLNEKEYFRLQAMLEKSGEKVKFERKEYFSSFIESAFNHPVVSINIVEQALKTDSSILSDSAKVSLLLLQRDNFFKTFQYAKAAAAGKELLDKYASALGNKRHDIENSLIIHEALRDIPPQQVHLQQDSFSWKRNRIGLIEIPIRVPSKKLNAVFDTRAYISTATKSFAKKLGLKILPATYEESSGLTGKTFKSQLGIADSLYVGNTLVEHVVFQVLPDEMLYFPTINYQMDGIIGFPVITALKEVRIQKSGTMIFETDGKKKESNLAFDASTTVVSFKTDEDTLSFHFDTGATSSDLYSRYFDKYKQRILKEGKAQTVEAGGAGGTIKTQVYVLPSVTFFIGDKKATLKEVSVRTSPIYEGQKYYGNLGQDLMTQFDEMILNFQYMYVAFQ